MLVLLITYVTLTTFITSSQGLECAPSTIQFGVPVYGSLANSTNFYQFKVNDTKQLIYVELNVGNGNLFITSPSMQSCPTTTSFRYKGGWAKEGVYNVVFLPDEAGFFVVGINSRLSQSYNFTVWVVTNGLDGFGLDPTKVMNGYVYNTMIYFWVNLYNIGLAVQTAGQSVSTYVRATDLPLSYQYDDKAVSSGTPVNATMCNAYTAQYYIGVQGLEEETAFSMSVFLGIGPSTADQLSSGIVDTRVLAPFQRALFAIDAEQGQVVSMFVEDLTVLGHSVFNITAGQDDINQCRPAIPSRYYATFLHSGEYRLIYQSNKSEPQIFSVQSTFNYTIKFTTQVSAESNTGFISLDVENQLSGYVTSTIFFSIDITQATSLSLTGSNVYLSGSQHSLPGSTAQRVDSPGILTLNECNQAVSNGQWFVGVSSSTGNTEQFQIYVNRNAGTVAGCSSPSDNKVWPIVVGVIGGVLVITILVAIVVIVVRRRRAHQKTPRLTKYFDTDDLNDIEDDAPLIKDDDEN